MVCKVAGDGAVFSSNLGINSSYALWFVPEREYKACSWVFMSLGQNVFMSLGQNVHMLSCPNPETEKVEVLMSLSLMS